MSTQMSTVVLKSLNNWYVANLDLPTKLLCFALSDVIVLKFKNIITKQCLRYNYWELIIKITFVNFRLQENEVTKKKKKKKISLKYNDSRKKEIDWNFRIWYQFYLYETEIL